MQRVLCLLIGYCFGIILTAEIVTRHVAGVRPDDIGSKNPGMANVMRELGFKPGIIVLAGDCAKTAAALFLCRALFPSLHALSMFYAMMGVVLGHNFPIWKHFRGGKGVAVTCVSIFIISPLWGLAANIVGFLAVLITGYLPLGAVLIPLAFIPLAFIYFGPESGVLIGLCTVIMFLRHCKGLRRIHRGEEKKMHLLKWIKNKKQHGER
ncbi:MAG TPA: acyl-phosphate glycerol 3-phosphate acyltransferase [Lachnospiraceae bacterium]|uniref:glycerol-3-phosphate acyltransferase n=1 Tax=Muricomes intestini TaxID=1796634 RepID=UPI000E8CFA68|nr:acyl-phosphate glycerol 3-phosphate acyltransferase [Lachnospiraceae bacterium]